MVYPSTDGSGRSVLYAHAGKMLGGNTAFAHFGTYETIDGEIVAKLRTKRHSRSPQRRSLVRSDQVTIGIRGRPQGKLWRFEGDVVEDASVFRAVMTPLGDDDVPPPGAVGEGGIISGLYSIDIRMLDGIAGGHTGVLLLHDGRILGEDAFFYYRLLRPLRRHRRPDGSDRAGRQAQHPLRRHLEADRAVRSCRPLTDLPVAMTSYFGSFAFRA